MNSGQNKLVLDAGLILSMTPATGYTEALGDKVILAGANTVNKATAGSPFILGVITTTTAGVVNRNVVSVRTKFNSQVELEAGENLVPGPVVLKGDGKVYNYKPKTVDSVGVVNIATNATGDGTVTLTIGGVAVAITPAASDTPATSLAALATAINANANVKNMGITATVTAGQLFLRSVGEIAKGVTLVAASTDSAQTIAVVAAAMACGVGWPIESVYGLCTNAPLSGASAFVLTNE